MILLCQDGKRIVLECYSYGFHVVLLSLQSVDSIVLHLS